MLDLDVNTAAVQKTTETAFAALGAAFKDLRPLYKEIDEDISTYIGRRYRDDHRWAPLKSSTLKARTRRWGWYRQKPETINTKGVWTGKARKRALKKGRVGKKNYTREFGPHDKIRARLSAFHLGRKDQAPRPIHEEKGLERIAAGKATASADRITREVDRLFTNLPQLGRVIR